MFKLLDLLLIIIVLLFFIFRPHLIAATIKTEQQLSQGTTTFKARVFGSHLPSQLNLTETSYTKFSLQSFLIEVGVSAWKKFGFKCFNGSSL